MKKEYFIETCLYNENDKYKLTCIFKNNQIHYEEKNKTKVIIMIKENKIIRESDNFLITLDFNKEMCIILDKALNLSTEISLEVKELISNDKVFYVEYMIEDSKYTYKISCE